MKAEGPPRHAFLDTFLSLIGGQLDSEKHASMEAIGINLYSSLHSENTILSVEAS